ncbi:MAG: hypothetical protein COW47_01830 [Candidatus Huberarchaeum crystalense]|uniref:Transmembrane protein n=1 Tax=Huberarchaeum crystalense TaxID=2014257 RepID=A0A2G9LJU9_HUBC1|nr:hypothetical protein [archaeon]OIP20751.1 MAG: hypothetical protein AUJ91_00570 [archaeon CG2_30_31_98]PIN66805.1 MAG: hypothetical protein COW69_00220 [Candidatus Huberarchaeum crystalense]NCS98318.1 hypothetical protein [archaeon]PIV13939.1 MAG: hypothetical protein COS45_00085 [Candidatus Huberarchaeum crystalense]
MQYEKIVKLLIGVLALVVIIYLTFMFFTQAGGKTKWVLYQDEEGTIPHVSDAVINYQCISKIELCAATGGGAAFEQCNGIELAKTCGILCEKYCKQKGKAQKPSCASWQNLKKYACKKDDLYSVSIILSAKTDNKNNKQIITKNNENTDKLNILSFGVVGSDDTNITIILNNKANVLDFNNSYAIYVSKNKINVMQLGEMKSENGKYLISTSCLLKQSTSNMENMCACT